MLDTDVSRTDCLKENVKRLSTFCGKIKLVFLPQGLNIEDELVRCCEIKNVIELTHSRSNKDFKRDFCALKNVRAVLEKANLNINRLWTENTPDEEKVLNNSLKDPVAPVSKLDQLFAYFPNCTGQNASA